MPTPSPKSPDSQRYTNTSVNNPSPLLSENKEVILSDLSRVDIGSDGGKNLASDTKILEWTLNEIRKTC